MWIHCFVGIRLNALQYGELKEKLHAPIREARGIIVQQTLGEKFTDAFKKQVEKNGFYNLPLSSPVSNKYDRSCYCYLN